MTVSPATAARTAAVRGAIARAAERTGVDFDYLLGQAQSESGLDPAAHARTSSAAGLYQFIDQSWLGTIKRHGAEHGLGWAADAVQRVGGRWTVADPAARQAVFALRQDPDASALMAAASASENAGTLRSALGRAVNGTDLYFAHFLGPAGARRFLKAADADPGASAAALFPREAAVNHAIFFGKGGSPRSLGQVYAMMGRKLGNGAEAAFGDIDRGATLMADGTMPLTKAAPGSADAALQTAALTVTGETPGTPLELLRQAGAAAQARADLLRPQPALARLAYLMVLSAIGA